MSDPVLDPHPTQVEIASGNKQSIETAATSQNNSVNSAASDSDINFNTETDTEIFRKYPNSWVCPFCNSLEYSDDNPANTFDDYIALDSKKDVTLHHCSYCDATPFLIKFNPPSEQLDYQEAVLPGEAECAYHPGVRAVTVCRGTGDYLCPMCRVEIDQADFGIPHLNNAGYMLANNRFRLYMPRRRAVNQIPFVMAIGFSTMVGMRLINRQLESEFFIAAFFAICCALGLWAFIFFLRNRQTPDSSDWLYYLASCNAIGNKKIKEFPIVSPTAVFTTLAIIIYIILYSWG